MNSQTKSMSAGARLRQISLTLRQQLRDSNRSRAEHFLDGKRRLSLLRQSDESGESALQVRLRYRGKR